MRQAWGRREMNAGFGREKPEGGKKRQLGRSKCEWKYNTEMDLKYDGMERMDSSGLGQD
jgi:hypothetical protein